MAERDAVEQASETAARDGEIAPGRESDASGPCVDPLEVAREAFSAEEPDDDPSRSRTSRTDGSDEG